MRIGIGEDQGKTRSTIGKRELSQRIKHEIAALVESFDLDQTLGTGLYEQICTDPFLVQFAERRRDAIAARIRKL